MPDRRWIWCGVFGAIVLASLLPSQPHGGPAGIGLTSLGHVPAYALLTAITLQLADSGSASRWRVAVTGAGVSIAVGGLLEAVQPLVGRDGNLTDLALDGVGTGIVVFAWWYGWLPRQHATSS